jgi:hypothetical protein
MRNPLTPGTIVAVRIDDTDELRVMYVHSTAIDSDGDCAGIDLAEYPGGPSVLLADSSEIEAVGAEAVAEATDEGDDEDPCPFAALGGRAATPAEIAEDARRYADALAATPAEIAAEDAAERAAYAG